MFLQYPRMDKTNTRSFMFVTFLAAAVETRSVQFVAPYNHIALPHWTFQYILLVISLQLKLRENYEFLTFIYNGVHYFNIHSVKYFFHHLNLTVSKLSAKANQMPLSMSELIKDTPVRTSCRSVNHKLGAKRRRENRGPEKLRSARATTTIAPSNTHACIDTGSRMFGYHSNTHTYFIRKHVVDFWGGGFTVNYDTYTGVSIFLYTVLFGSEFEEKD